MKPITHSKGIRKGRARVAFLAMSLALALGVSTGCRRSSTGMITLSQAVVQSEEGGWGKRIEVGAGAFTLGLARLGLSFVELPDEARTVLGAVRGVRVGIYERRGDSMQSDRRALLEAADEAMSAKRWERMVTVIDGNEFVVVYVSSEISSRTQMEMCVMVIDGDEMVIVGARGNPEPIITMALEHAQRELPSGPRA